MTTTTSRRKGATRTAPSSPSAITPIRFDSINEMCTGTNDDHVKLLLDELPWMRAGIRVLNMNDRELEAKIYTGGSEGADAWLDVVEALTAIRDRHQLGINICNAASARIVHVLERIQAEAVQ